MKKPTLNPNLKDFWTQREINGERVRYRILYGGRDSSKSWDAAGRSMWLSQLGQLRVLCTRMFQNRIEDSVYETIKTQAYRFNLDHKFRFQNTRIYSKTGSQFLFYGIARNIKEIKSLEGIDILYVEEGHSLTKDKWDIIEPTIRKEGSEIWIVFNPDLATDFVYDRFVVNPPRNAIVRKINYDENPFLSETSKKTIEAMKEERYSDYEHIYLGVPKQDDDAVIIKRKWIEACVDAHGQLGIEISGERIIGYDPADGNEKGTADNNAMAMRYGILLKDTDEWQAGEDELVKSTRRVYAKSMETGSSITYDSIGVGASVGSNVKESNKESGKEISYQAFNAGGKVLNPEKEYKPKVKNKDQFSNLKAQCWWMLADRFRNTYNATIGNEYDKDNLISISSECRNLEKLIKELSTPKRDYDSANRLKVESKKDLSKRSVKSPNLADAIVMAYAPPNLSQNRAGVLF